MHWQPFLYFYSIQIKIKTMCFHFFYIEQVDTIYQKVLYNSCCFCFYIMEFRKQKNIFCTSEALLCFTQKNNLCIMNKIKLVWFYSLYRNYFFEEKCDLFMYFKNIFYYITLKIFFKYWIILHIFRISLYVTSP